jgi:hypothetical protein
MRIVGIENAGNGAVTERRNREQDFYRQQHGCRPPRFDNEIMEFFKGAQHKRAAGKTMIDAGTREVSHDGSAIFEKRMLPPGALFWMCCTPCKRKRGHPRAASHVALSPLSWRRL